MPAEVNLDMRKCGKTRDAGGGGTNRRAVDILKVMNGNGAPLARISHRRPNQNEFAMPRRNSANAIFPVDTVLAQWAITQRPKFRQRQRLLVPAYQCGRNVGSR
jgi:hypothetical protein